MAYYLIFDTETTGLPLNWSSHPRITPVWPRLVQIAWQVYTKKGKLLREEVYLIRPNNFTIPKESTQKHGITHTRATQEGKDLKDVLSKFLEQVTKISTLVAHNAKFDISVVAAECYRLQLPVSDLFQRTSICTMRSTVNLCCLPAVGRYPGWKYPQLNELYHYLFRKSSPYPLHDALGDVKTTGKCFFKLLLDQRKAKDITWEYIQILDEKK